MYRVQDANQQTFYLRKINALSNEQSIDIVERMQTKLIHVQHPNLVQYLAIAVESESPLIKFIVLEEDLGESALTLKQLKDCILTNHLLVRYFNEKLYIYSFLV